MADSAALRRVTDLFVEGTEMVLDEHDPVIVWINKLNPFQVDEARKDGQAARTRYTLALNDPRSEESQEFDLRSANLDDDTLAAGMAQAKYQQFLVAAADDMRSDKEWAEKSNALDRASEQLADRPVDDPERVAMDKLAEEYYAELEERADAKREAEREGLRALPHEELRQKYRQQWIEERATSAFLTEYRITELWYALRECFSSGKDDNGRWKHEKCDHRIKLLDDRQQVRQLPDELIRQARHAVENLVVDDRSSKDSAEARKSSGSSPRPNAQEGSAPSTPAATPPAQATTST